MWGKSTILKRRLQAFTLSTFSHRYAHREIISKSSSLLLVSQNALRSSSPTDRNSHADCSDEKSSYFSPRDWSCLRQIMLWDMDSLYLAMERLSLDMLMMMRVYVELDQYSLLSHMFLHSQSSLRLSSLRPRERRSWLSSSFFWRSLLLLVPKMSARFLVDSLICSIAFQCQWCVRQYSAKLSQKRLMIGVLPAQKMSSSILMKDRSNASSCFSPQSSQLMAESTISQWFQTGVSVSMQAQMERGWSGEQGMVLESWMLTLGARQSRWGGTHWYSSWLTSISSSQLFSLGDCRLSFIWSSTSDISQQLRQLTVGLKPSTLARSMALFFLKRTKVFFMLTPSRTLIPALNITENSRYPGRILSFVTYSLNLRPTSASTTSHSQSLSFPFPNSWFTRDSTLSVASSSTLACGEESK